MHLRYIKIIMYTCFVVLNLLYFVLTLLFYYDSNIMSFVFVCGILHTLAFNRAQKDLFELENK